MEELNAKISESSGMGTGSGMFDLHIQNLSRAQALFDTLNKQTRNEYSDLIRLKKTVPIL